MAAPPAASVAPLVNTAPRLPARRGAIARPVARGHAVRASVVGAGGENASGQLESTTRRGTPLPLPSHFDLDTAVLLGGFAFESYSTPEGGVVDADVNGCSTAYLSDFVREVYSGVLEVTMVRGENLPRGDKLGLSDPYCVVSVGAGGSSARTKTKRFTLDPKWDEEAPMRLLVRRRDASGERRNQTLTVRVLDEDAGKSDDLLGVARLPLADLIDGSLVKIPLTGEIGLAREEEVTAELTSEGGGIGGGKIVARLRFVPFNPRADEVVGEGLRRAARIMERKGERDGSDSMKLAAKAAGAVAGGLAFVTTELSRGEREGGLWEVRPDGEWATLATEKRLRVRGKDASPHDFEKVCFVESVRTDTQAAVWRCAADKTVVISFRGTEMSKPLDVLTDVNLAPAAFSPERVEVEGEDEPGVHGVSSRRAIASSGGSSEQWTTSWRRFIPGARTRGRRGARASIEQGERRWVARVRDRSQPGRRPVRARGGSRRGVKAGRETCTSGSTSGRRAWETARSWRCTTTWCPTAFAW